MENIINRTGQVSSIPKRIDDGFVQSDKLQVYLIRRIINNGGEYQA